ncbi:MAG: N-formyl-4-amino-5-aminomethyl-2-methylpyrimidine deformylase [Chroococcidiopsis cubana SAG 39.79]|uniref:Acetylornithine deacetylase n=1 Tax=Chroococcidiopsis cubana SAG 39.79 TaxID=388085 RepID=A0AB37UEM3_9CYAN|nr:M20 family metallopeptidase [Chroococcidiopsis cubana]MDZ4872208.1 N-formyl-4-amino-5-aminomethyl-2-methylpyrimidine deformylase [Chroococcidiopsis cubana SAG 39.79]PSB63944.1 peptidase M20 [Chroococcidiopsis cubana CCALA 043]RUT07978.1 acetylornithine deacetylase [Chroococcidiopsis cubana SAG 39.79]
MKLITEIPGLSKLEQDILQTITEERCVQLIEELVPIGQPVCGNSIDPEVPSGYEEDIAKHVAEKLRLFGLKVELIAAVEGRPNVVASWDDGVDGPTLILNDHLDTYPACDPMEWHKTGHNPYRPTRYGQYLYARGTSDTRGNLACQLIAIESLRQAKVAITGKLICAYCVDEERHGGLGAKYLLEQKGLTGDYEITAEPSAWTDENEWGIGIAVAHSGCCVLDLEISGIRSHIWRPDEGINPILQMTRLLEALSQATFTHEPPALYGPVPPSICPVKIEAGKFGEGQFTPPACKARVWIVGLVPGMTYESIVQDIESVVTSLQKNDTQFNVKISPVPGETFVPASIEVPADTAHVRAISKAYSRVLGKEPALYRKNAYCDTLRFSHSGIPSITFGPGEDGWSPVNEAIDIDKVVAATQIYALALIDLLQAKLP